MPDEIRTSPGTHPADTETAEDLRLRRSRRPQIVRQFPGCSGNFWLNGKRERTRIQFSRLHRNLIESGGKRRKRNRNGLLHRIRRKCDIAGDGTRRIVRGCQFHTDRQSHRFFRKIITDKTQNRSLVFVQDPCSSQIERDKGNESVFPEFRSGGKLRFRKIVGKQGVPRLRWERTGRIEMQPLFRELLRADRNPGNEKRSQRTDIKIGTERNDPDPVRETGASHEPAIDIEKESGGSPCQCHIHTLSRLDRRIPVDRAESPFPATDHR